MVRPEMRPRRARSSERQRDERTTDRGPEDCQASCAHCCRGTRAVRRPPPSEGVVKEPAPIRHSRALLRPRSLLPCAADRDGGQHRSGEREAKNLEELALDPNLGERRAR